MLGKQSLKIVFVAEMSGNGLKMRRNRGVKCAVLVENCETVAGSWSQERERKRGERNFG